MTREDGAGLEALEFTLCVQPPGGGDQVSCTIDVDVDSTTHWIEFVADDAPCHGEGEVPVEVNGTWATEDSPIEIVHSD